MRYKTVITFGTYDLFHIGHLNIIRRAAELGDRLVVGVASDAFNFRKKGVYPFVRQEERAEIISALRWVDEVFYEESFELKRQYILDAGADLMVMGDDWAGRFDEFEDVCDVVYLPRTEGISTTHIKVSLAANS